MSDRYTARHAAWRAKRSRRRTTRKFLPAAAALTVAGVIIGGAGAALHFDQPAPVSTAYQPTYERTEAADRASRNDLRSTPTPTPTASTSPTRKPAPKPTVTGAVVSSGSCAASYYDEPQGTANGETFDPEALTAAHKSLPFDTRVRVTNLASGKAVVVRINDRGPYVAGRCLDLSRAAFRTIANLNSGVVNVKYEVLK